MYHEIPWTFKKWIACFKNVDLPIGDLAKDISEDPAFPDEDYFGEILEHISNEAKYDSDIVETFVLAWGYYLASKDPSHTAFTSL